MANSLRSLSLMNRTTLNAALALVGSAVVVAGVAKTEQVHTAPAATAAAAPAAAATPNMVTFNARDFAFEGPDSIPAGLTMFHLNASGNDLHHVQLIKLEQGKTYADFEA